MSADSLYRLARPERLRLEFMPKLPEKRPRGRPPTIDTAHLLKVAREVFLARGIRATTLEVAERAGVSEGSIFNRFKTKEALFREAMELSEEDVPQRLIDALDAAFDDEDFEVALHRLAQSMVDIARVALPLMMMAWSNPCGGPTSTNALKFREFVLRLSAFFQRQIDAGRLRPVDPEIAARTFLGSIHHYCMSRMFADEHGIPVLAEAIFIRGHVDLLLRGAMALEVPRSSPYSRALD
jgi:AcrR family transcriptional regulator